MKRYRFDDDFNFRECIEVLGWAVVMLFFTATLALFATIL